MLKTALYDEHVRLGARIVDFHGWQMPVQYTSIVEEHRSVRQRVGMFDVSHMGRFRFTGPGAFGLTQNTITNDAGKLTPGGALYALICQEDGGILDDLIVYRLDEMAYRLVVNASNRQQDWEWLTGQPMAGSGVHPRDESDETVMIAVQGPEAAALVQRHADVDLSALRFMTAASGRVAGQPCFIARTGYTGEDGFELVGDADAGAALWRTLHAAGATPCGLGARDTLRLEAALPLYGNDIDRSTNPLEAGLAWAVALDKGYFVGEQALQAIKAAGVRRRLICFEMVERGIPRQHYPIAVDGRGVGEVTSGTFSPTLEKGIGMGYVPVEHAEAGTELTIVIRERPTRARVVKRPFYKRGKR